MAAVNESQKKYFVIALAVLVFLLSIFLIYTQYNALRDLRAEVELEEMAVTAARSRLNRLVDHRNNAPEYEERLQYATRMIPPEPGEDAMLRYIQSLTQDYDLRAIEIRFDARSEQDGYTSMPLTITIEGSYNDLRMFLRQLYIGSRAVRINDIRLSRAGAGSDLRVSLAAVTFYNHNN